MKRVPKTNNKAVVGCLMCLLLVVVLLFNACDPASSASRDISNQADNFNTTRRIIVINTRTDHIEAEIIGTFSLKNNSSNELEVIVCIGQEVYIKNFIQLNKNIHYHVEDLSYADLPQYYYTYNINPVALTDVHTRTDDLP